MNNIYSYSTGQVKVLSGVALPALVYLYGTGQWVTNPEVVFITTVQGENVVGHQFVHTLRDYIYAYVFGERIGTLALGGKAVTNGCTGSGGIGNISSFYAMNRLTQAIYTPTQPLVQVVIGTSVLAGFLVKLQMQIENPDVAFADFTMTIKTMHN